jgi:acetyltransferase
MNLDNLFNPKSIAVVGVSKDPSKLGAVVYSNITSSGYEGKVYPVNPKYNKIFNHKCYSNVSQIKGQVDLVIYVIPAQFILDDLKKILKHKRLKGVVIISAGFRDEGEEGAKLEIKIAEIIRTQLSGLYKSRFKFECFICRNQCKSR